jgi:molybdopterin adenylyltransferase
MTIRFGILTISDRSARGERADASGPALADMIRSQAWSIVKQGVLPDDDSAIRTRLREWADRGDVDVILTTGGTGFAPKDVTPEATRAVLDREAPGLAEAIRTAGLAKTPHSMLSRLVTGIRKKTIIINLPGNPKGAVESLEVIIPVLEHAVKLMQDDPKANEGHQV